MNTYSNCSNSHEFLSGTTALSLVDHSPEVQSGDLIKIVKSWNECLCAVQLPNGMLHRWFAWFELRVQNSHTNEYLIPGRFATVINVTGHGNPPHIAVGTTVKIVRCIPTTFYDVMLKNGEYHRWLADFELGKPI